MFKRQARTNCPQTVPPLGGLGKNRTGEPQTIGHPQTLRRPCCDCSLCGRVPKSGEAGDRRRLVVEYLEDSVQLGDLQQIFDPFVKTQQLHYTALIRDGSKSGYHLPNSRAVDVGNLGKIEQQLLLSASRQVADGVAKRARSVSQGDSTHGVDNCYVSHLSGGHFYAHALLLLTNTRL